MKDDVQFSEETCRAYKYLAYIMIKLIPYVGASNYIVGNLR